MFFRSITTRAAACMIAATAGTGCNATEPSRPRALGAVSESVGIVSESIGAGTCRFHADAAAQKNALPSFALEKPRPGTGPAPAGWKVLPRFSTEGNKQVVRVAVDAGTSCYGTGEVAGPLLRNGRTVTAWNTDAFGYGDDAPSLYKTFPWVLAVRADGSAFGVLADTTYRLEIDLKGVTTTGGEMVFRADGRAFPVIVIERPSAAEVVAALAELTGKIELPPKWALGYHQCRYSYFPDTRVMEIAKGFRDRDIPCDVIWHDIDYMNKFMCFTFDPKSFPDPKRHNADLHKLGFKTVWMIDPGIGADSKKFPPGGYSVYESGTAGDHWVKKADGKTDYNGEVWPGMCVFPDYTRAETRRWWAGLYKDFMATGIDGVWNDMNEPAVFNTPDKSKTMPEDNVHRADADLGGPGPHARFHNIYGTLMVKASREGIMAANPDKRPFVLSRAIYLGGQRYAASWTGDNSADWYHLESSVPMVLNLSLSGQPFCGPDIGGFAGNGPDGEAGAQMFARWMGFGALLPFSRAHTATGNIDKEPWSFGAKAEETCRTAIQRRYILMPYIYSLFREASVSGMPVARPLFFADPTNPALRSEDDGFLLGDSLMVVAQMVPDGSRAVALPRGDWRKIAIDDKPANPDLPDLYQKAGTIIPAGPVMEFVDEKPLDPLTLHVALNASGKASGTLYEDAGEGWGFKKGEYRLTTFEASLEGGEVKVKAVKVEGSLPEVKRSVRVVVHAK